MRNKTSLVLMEQVVMILVFALAAAICLQIFVLSDRLSKEQEAKANAAILAQNTAEWLKNQGSVDIEALSEITKDSVYELRVVEETADISGLIRVKIIVSEGTKTLFELPAAWQEVAAHE